LRGHGTRGRQDNSSCPVYARADGDRPSDFTNKPESGKSLIVYKRREGDTAPVELVVFDVPAFTARFTAKAGGTKTGFIGLAWAPNSKALYAIEARFY